MVYQAFHKRWTGGMHSIIGTSFATESLTNMFMR